MSTTGVAAVPGQGVRHEAPLLAALLIITAAAAAAAQYLSHAPLVGFDDANIFFVYARNVLDGHGLVYYAGGERVEGFTSPAWLLLCLIATGATAWPEATLLAFNVLLFAATALVVIRCIEGFVGRWLAVIVTLTCLLQPGYVVWATISLMDTGIWCAALTCAYAAILWQARRALLFVVAALTVTRPEAMLWVPGLLAVAVMRMAIEGTPLTAALRSYARHAIVFVTTLAGMTLFRVLYFGYPLPNTYYVKASGETFERVRFGLRYLADFLSFNPVVVFAIVLVLITTTAAVRRRQQVSMHVSLLAMLGLALIIPVLAGGDHFGFSRMLQPAMPLAAIIIAAAATFWSAALRRPTLTRLIGVAGGVAAAFGMLLWRVLPDLSYQSSLAESGEWQTPRIELSIAADMRDIGRAFTATFRDGPPSVGVIVAGGFALEYAGPTIDLMGLNNVAMGHSPGERIGSKGHAAFDSNVFYSLRPQVLLLSLWSPNRPDWLKFPMLAGPSAVRADLQPDYFERRAASVTAFNTGVFKGLLSEPRLAELYRWASVRRRPTDPWMHAVFLRSYAQELTGRGYEVVYPPPPPR